MQEIKPNWKVAAQVSALHTRISTQITSTLLLLAFILFAIFLKITGQPLTLNTFVNYFLEYKKIIIPIILLVHFIPVNLYAVIKVLQHHYLQFKIKLVKIDPSDEGQQRQRPSF